jgi:hypothetical protein
MNVLGLISQLIIIETLRLTIMFVNYENNIYTKHHKTFSKKCVLENDFFVRTKHIKTFFNYFQDHYQTQENESVFQKMLFGK